MGKRGVIVSDLRVGGVEGSKALRVKGFGFGV